MDQKEPQKGNTDKLRINAHYQAMNDKELDELTEALASIIVGYLEKEENHESRSLSKEEYR